jgi:hypothetical protein
VAGCDLGGNMGSFLRRGNMKAVDLPVNKWMCVVVVNCIALMLSNAYAVPSNLQTASQIAGLSAWPADSDFNLFNNAFTDLSVNIDFANSNFPNSPMIQIDSYYDSDFPAVFTDENFGIDVNFFSSDHNICSHFLILPEPATMVVLGFGSQLLMYKGRK